MEKPRNDSKNLFNQYPAGIDIASSLFSGLLIGFGPVTWVNDPLNKAGIAFATLLNSTLLGIGNKIGKTNQSKSPYYRNAITVGALGLGAFSAPHIAQQLNVVLSSRVALYIAGMNLCVKVGGYVVYLLIMKASNYFSTNKPDDGPDPKNGIPPKNPDGPKGVVKPMMPANCEAITQYTQEELTQFHDYFQTEQGTLVWKSLYMHLKLCFIEHFDKNNIPIKDHEIDPNKINSDEFVKYQNLLWKYVHSGDVHNLDRKQLLVAYFLFYNFGLDCWNKLSDDSKISFISQSSKNNIGISLYVDDYHFGEEYWAHIASGDLATFDESKITLLYSFFQTKLGKQKWSDTPQHQKTEFNEKCKKFKLVELQI